MDVFTRSCKLLTDRENPLHLWLQACGNEKSQGSLVSSRCNTTQRFLVSRVSSLPEESRWLHCACCNVSPPERAARATGTAGSGLSRKTQNFAGTCNRRRWAELENSIRRAPLKAHLFNPEICERPNGMEKAEISVWQVRNAASEGWLDSYCGCWNQQ